MAMNPQTEYQDAVIYARYSSHAQRDVSIEQQIRACEKFADRHGLRIVHVYEDRALTGTSDKRPGFQRMVKDAKISDWKYVVVYTLDRFARDRYDSAVYKRQLKNAGVKVLSAMENISDDPTGVLMESLLEGLAEYYTKKGKEWNKSSFNRILSNERYTGLYHYRDIVVPGGIPAIIPQALFDEVQAICYLKKNPRQDPTGSTPQRRRREGGLYLLTGKLFCGHCKEPMIGISGTSHTDTPHYYYTCKGRRADHDSCSKRNVRRDTIESFVATALRDTMLTDESILALADAVMEYQRKCVTDLGIESLQSQLDEVNKSIANIMAAIEAGIFSSTTQARLTELETKQRDLTRLLTVAQAEAEAQLTREDIITCLKMFQAGDVNSKDYQEALFDTFLVAAYVYDKEVKLVFHLGGKKKKVKVPFNIDDVDLLNVCITPSAVDQK